MTTPPETKTITASVEIDATPEAVWEALTTKEGLERWFPLEAWLDPGVGGSIRLSWGPGVEGTAPIEVWEEGRRLVWMEEFPGDPSPVKVAVDFQIEGRSGTTVVRLVHSGFQATDDWSDYLDTLDSGWRYFLFNLKHCLERHPGSSRRMVWRRVKIAEAKEPFWRRLLSDVGLVRPDGALEAGSFGRVWSGEDARVVQVTAPIHFAALVPAWNDGLMFLELEPGTDGFHLGVWLSLYGLDPQVCEALDSDLECALAQVIDAGP